MRYRYKIYELVIDTPFLCPMLLPAPSGSAPVITIVEGSVPKRLDNFAATDNRRWDAAPGRFLLRGGSRAGRFLVEDGEKVTLERNPEAEDGKLAAYFVTWVLVAILRQRGLLVLHANAAKIPGGAVAISGNSGAGKTTTLAALVGHGCLMLADDVTVLRFDKNRSIVALPGISKINLCEDAAIRMGHDIGTLPRNPLRDIKLMAPVHENMATEPTVLRAVYLLSQYDGSELVVTPLRGQEKFAALQECVYGPLLPGEHPGQFALFAAVSEQVAFYRILRPESRWSINEVVEAILHG